MNCKKCKKSLSNVIEWNTTSVGYNLNTETLQYEGAERYSDHMDFENYACGFCGSPLSIEQAREIMDRITN